MSGREMIYQQLPTEKLIAEQRADYDQLLAVFVTRIEAFDISDETKRKLIEQVRAMLAADLERFAREVAEVNARGLRGNDEQVH